MIHSKTLMQKFDESDMFTLGKPLHYKSISKKKSGEKDLESKRVQVQQTFKHV